MCDGFLLFLLPFYQQLFSQLIIHPRVQKQLYRGDVHREAFEQALREGRSGIRFQPLLEELKFGCQIAGVPENFDAIRKSYFDHEKLLSINDNIGYASVSAVDAWTDGGFTLPGNDDDTVDWDTGVIAGSGVGGMDTIAQSVVPMINEGRVKRLGSRVVEQVMNSGTSARIGGLIGAGNQVTSNSSEIGRAHV